MMMILPLPSLLSLPLFLDSVPTVSLSLQLCNIRGTQIIHPMVVVASSWKLGGCKGGEKDLLFVIGQDKWLFRGFSGCNLTPRNFWVSFHPMFSLLAQQGKVSVLKMERFAEKTCP